MSAYSSGYVAADLHGNNQSIGDLTGDAHSTICSTGQHHLHADGQPGGQRHHLCRHPRNNSGTGRGWPQRRSQGVPLTPDWTRDHTGATTINTGTLAYSYGTGATFSFLRHPGNGRSLTATAGRVAVQRQHDPGRRAELCPEWRQRSLQGS
ncbi:MAG: hypothetical protein U1F77_05255 [Kiritimatiellia bacterium]